MGINFETEQTDQRRPTSTIFEKCVQAIIMESMLSFRNMGKVEGEVAGHSCDNSSFILMIVCLLFLSFFLSARFLFLLHIKEQL